MSTKPETSPVTSFAPSGTQSLPPRNIRVLGVPLDMGASRRGVDMGPSAMRVAGLEARLESLGHHVSDGGNVAVDIAETQNFGSPNARYLKQIADTCARTAAAVSKTLEDGMTPLVLGGDHSIAVGSVSGVSEFYRRQNQKIGIIWIDAHSDINTPDTSPSGNVHGMPLAALLGLGPDLLTNIGGFTPKIAPENTSDVNRAGLALASCARTGALMSVMTGSNRRRLDVARAPVKTALTYFRALAV